MLTLSLTVSLKSQYCTAPSTTRTSSTWWSVFGENTLLYAVDNVSYHITYLSKLSGAPPSSGVFNQDHKCVNIESPNQLTLLHLTLWFSRFCRGTVGEDSIVRIAIPHGVSIVFPGWVMYLLSVNTAHKFSCVQCFFFFKYNFSLFHSLEPSRNIRVCT